MHASPCLDCYTFRHRIECPGPDTSIETPGSYNLPNQRGLFVALQRIQRQASSAAASTSDTIHSSSIGENDISTAAALDSALEASDVSNDDLYALATTLAQIAKASFDRQHSASPDKQHRTAWAAVTRAVMRPERWLPTPPSRSQTVLLSGGRTCRTKGQITAELRKWTGLRRPIPCKYLLRHDTQVTSLSYLPLAMLVASGTADGRVRLWDPCARRHKLAPSPTAPVRHGTFSGDDFDAVDSASDLQPQCTMYSRRTVDHRHLRTWPGVYVETPEEWTETGKPFGCVAEFSAVPWSDSTNTGGRREERSVRNAADGRQDDNSRRRRPVKITMMDVVAIPGGDSRSLVVCDANGARTAKQMDKEEPWDPASAGTVGELCSRLFCGLSSGRISLTCVDTF